MTTETRARLRLWFAHQSVGADIMQGLRNLAENDPDLPPIIETTDPREVPGGAFIAHGRVGRNFDPGAKLREFRERLENGGAEALDVAMLKFCYVDVQDEAAAVALFEAYRTQTAEFGRQHPHLLLAHVTLPLRHVPGNLYTRARTWLQGPPKEQIRNAARHRYNELLRQAYGRDAFLFDLAAIEAVKANGRASFSGSAQDLTPSLAAEWTSDGGHLNEQGRRIAATEFRRFFSTLQDYRCRQT